MLEAPPCSLDRPLKKQRSNPLTAATDPIENGLYLPSPLHPSLIPDSSPMFQMSITRPWKDVYSERLTIERNWRRGRCSVRTLKGHTDGVMCLQFAETLAHGPSCPILITGSYDRTVRVWNLETGAELRCLQGHTRAIRALQFDAAKLITGSMDHTIRVWNWREGRCVRTLTGHEGGVVCLNFDSNVLASGGVDAKIKVWNLRTQEAFTLRGHTDWVNAVQLWDSNNVPSTLNASPSSMPVFEPFATGMSSVTAEPHIDPGKMLFSASDDGTIRLWDLTLRSCVRQFAGHVAQVQSMRLQVVDDECDGVVRGGGVAASNHRSSQMGIEEQHQMACFSSREEHRQHVLERAATGIPLLPGSLPDKENNESRPSFHTIRSGHLPSYSPQRKRPHPVLVSGSLDNTIKLWDIDTGKTLRTFFGHIEGVWAVASDKLRLVSGSHDRTIKVCVHLSPTLVAVPMMIPL
jgi:F-box and WD-40 domain protein MET30